ncbi:NAD-dependent protein deacylase Sirt4-like isoform X2 [Homarus americanus]|nr:NAD-dependent protein deacylase Sirt4-like isoform X2 [Homarus americanus]
MFRSRTFWVKFQGSGTVRWCCTQFAYVPKHRPCQDQALICMQEFMDSTRKLFVLTGAGISTESGIPDYRSEGVGLYATSTKRPVHLKIFKESSKARQSYWARNYVGWPRFSSFKPNVTHTTLVEWERKDKVHCVVTQNVDRLHHKAGSHHVHELHGTAFNVICMSCNQTLPRHSFQTKLRDSNQHMSARYLEIRPDGDVELTQDEVNSFQVPPCERCGGILKPDIVFFGDNVPRGRVEKVRQVLAACDGLLVLGSSLFVYSGYRFILQALESRIRVSAINIGPTRADKHLSFRVDARCGEVLPRLVV